MNKLVYVAVVILALAFIAALVSNNSTPSPKSTTSVSQVTSNYPTTLVTSIANVSYNTTTSVTPPACSSLPGYDCAKVKCTPINSTFTCTNATYIYSPTNGTTFLWVTVGQNTGTSWSGFGVGFAPNGTKLNQGVPLNIVYNTAASQSTSNVGTSLQDGANATVKADSGKSGAGYGPNINGTVWVCYINSGILYVGNGCTTSSRQPSMYAEVGKITTS